MFLTYSCESNNINFQKSSALPSSNYSAKRFYNEQVFGEFSSDKSKKDDSEDVKLNLAGFFSIMKGALDKAIIDEDLFNINKNPDEEDRASVSDSAVGDVSDKIKTKEIRFSINSPIELFNEDDSSYSNELLDDYIEYPSYINSEGIKVYEGEYPKEIPSFNMFNETINPAKYLDIYDAEGNIIAKTLSDEFGNNLASKFYELNSQGESYLAFEELYLKDGKIKITKTYDSNGQYYTLTQFEDENKREKHLSLDSVQSAQNILKRNILDYPQFEAQDICELAQLDDDSWQNVEQILKQDKNANLDEISKQTGLLF